MPEIVIAAKDKRHPSILNGIVLLFRAREYPRMIVVLGLGDGLIETANPHRQGTWARAMAPRADGAAHGTFPSAALNEPDRAAQV